MHVGGRGVLVSFLLLLASCTGGPSSSSSDQGGAAFATVDVVVSPMNLAMAAGTRVTFTASVTGVADTGVTWSVQEGSAGGAIDPGGTYVAPVTPGTFHVVATSRADSTRSAIATVTVTPPSPTTVAITVAPSAVVLAVGAQQTFSCGVIGSSDAACSYSVQEGAAGGAIDASGRYTAPGTPGTYHVVATSHADSTKSAAAPVVVTSASATAPVAVTPASASIAGCQAVALSATVPGASDPSVTWSLAEGSAGGTISAQGAYTAPSAAGTYHAVATSVADPTKSQSIAIVVSDKVLSVMVSPSEVTLQAGQTVQFTAIVTTTCGSSASVNAVAAPSGA